MPHLGLNSSEVSLLFECPDSCRAADSQRGVALSWDPARLWLCGNKHATPLEQRLGLGTPTYPARYLHFKLNSPVALKMLFVCEAQPCFSFSVSTQLEVIVDCFPNTLTKGPVDQSDKAILVPFLEYTENSFKAMQKRELLFTLPLLCYRKWRRRESVRLRTLPMYPRL